MRKLAALSGAVLLTLVLAAPAAAAQKVQVWDDVHWVGSEPVSIANHWPFECDPGPIYYNWDATENLWLWFEKGAAPTDPWIKGQYTNEGVDAFSELPDVGGLVASGKYKFTSHLSGFDPGPPPTWLEQVTGKFWGIQIPGLGTVFHESGNIRQTATETNIDPLNPIEYVKLRQTGNETFDAEALCGFFGFGVKYAPPPPTP